MIKIDNQALQENAVQKDQIFSRTNKAASFDKTIETHMEKVEHAVRNGQSGYDRDELFEKGELEKLQEQFAGESQGAAAMQDQMAVLSNTMSPEDYQKLKEDGYSINSTDGATMVTVTDKIKAQLAKAGVDVSDMGGELTREQMEAISGSVIAANQLEQCYRNADIPDTEQNMTEGMEAYQQAGELTDLSDGAVKYLLDNRLLPTINNLYLAEFSGSTAMMQTDPQIDFDSLRTQMEQVITAAGYSVDENTMHDAEWMIANEIPFTADNFSYMQKLNGLQLPADGEAVAEAIATAVTEGARPADAMLLPEYTITAQADHVIDVLAEATDEDIASLVKDGLELTAENLETVIGQRKSGRTDASAAQTVIPQEGEPVSDQGYEFLKAKRVLEETRLLMTTEANRAMIRQGISIDTRPLEELVEQLKQQETDYYQNLFSDEVGQADAAELYSDTTGKLAELKEMPAYVLGMGKTYPLDTVEQLHEAGSVLQAKMEQAGERYETLMTAPRSDLGDSIQKAFANVDDILDDLGIEKTEANQRAVRILAYNSLEINEESIQTMKTADEKVQRTFSNLTPATVRELIKQGQNPLDMGLDELNSQAEAIRNANGDDGTERFSEYLWKLEQNKEISPEERESYIGIYRLMNQVERTDGAAIGALVTQEAEFTMRNLLTAVRSAKKNGMDYTIDDSFSGVDQVADGSSITDQIDTAYQADCMKDVMESLTPVVMQKLLSDPDWENYTPEQLKWQVENYKEELSDQERAADYDYAKSQTAELAEAAQSDEEVYQILEHYSLPVTVDNLMAVNRMVTRKNQVFSTLFNSDDVFSGEPVDFEGIREEILQRFANAMETPEEMAAAQETLAETAENVMKTMIADDEHITSMDIRELKLMCTQLSVAGEQAKEEQYTIPVLVGDEVTSVSLKVVRGTKKKGMVEIMFETEKRGRIEAAISAKEDGVSGLIATDSRETEELLRNSIGEIAGQIGEDGAADLAVVFGSSVDQKTETGTTENTEQTDSDKEIQTARLYKIAKSFLTSVKEVMA